MKQQLHVEGISDLRGFFGNQIFAPKLRVIILGLHCNPVFILAVQAHLQRAAHAFHGAERAVFHTQAFLVAQKHDPVASGKFPRSVRGLESLTAA